MADFFLDAVDELRKNVARQKQLKFSQVATTGAWCFGQAAILGMVVSDDPDEFLPMVWDPNNMDKFWQFVNRQVERVERARTDDGTGLGFLVMTTRYPELYGTETVSAAVASGKLNDVERLANSSVPAADAQKRWSADTALGLGFGILRPDFVRRCIQAQANPDRESWSRAHQAGLNIPAEPDAMSADEQIEGVLEVCGAYFQEYYPQAKRKLDELSAGRNWS